VLVIITDYGRLSVNLDRLKCKLSEEEIAFHTVTAGGWSACSTIEKHHRTTVQLKELFKNCCAKNTITLSNSSLYRCPFIANADRLAAITSLPSDRVDLTLLNSSTEAVFSKKKEIREFLFGREYIEACDYCKGRPFTATEIEPAIQLDRPVKYKRA